MSMKKTTGVALAVAAAGMFAIAPVNVMAGSEGKVHCYGVNKCKGQNDCKSLFNSCKGQSSCKGKGFISVTKAECDEMGGKVGE